MLWHVTVWAATYISARAKTCRWYDALSDEAKITYNYCGRGPSILSWYDALSDEAKITYNYCGRGPSILSCLK